MRALIEALEPHDQFKSSAAHSAAIVAFVLVALSSPLAGDDSLDGDDDRVKKSIVLAIPMATCYRPYSVVTFVDIRGVETTVALVYGRRAGRRCGAIVAIRVARRNHPGQVPLRERRPLPPRAIPEPG